MFYQKYIKKHVILLIRPPHHIGGGTHFSGGTNPDNGGTFVPPFKLLKYALKTGASNIQADANRCKQRQTVSLVDVTHSLDNNIFPLKFNWSAQPKCWPRPID